MKSAFFAASLVAVLGVGPCPEVAHAQTLQSGRALPDPGGDPRYDAAQRAERERMARESAAATARYQEDLRRANSIRIEESKVTLPLPDMSDLASIRKSNDSLHHGSNSAFSHGAARLHYTHEDIEYTTDLSGNTLTMEVRNIKESGPPSQRIVANVGSLSPGKVNSHRDSAGNVYWDVMLNCKVHIKCFSNHHHSEISKNYVVDNTEISENSAATFTSQSDLSSFMKIFKTQ